MNTSKSGKKSVTLFIALSFSTFLYLNICPHSNSTTLPQAVTSPYESPIQKEGAGLMPEVDLIKETYSKLKEIKPLFKSGTTP